MTIMLKKVLTIVVAVLVVLLVARSDRAAELAPVVLPWKQAVSASLERVKYYPAAVGQVPGLRSADRHGAVDALRPASRARR